MYANASFLRVSQSDVRSSGNRLAPTVVEALRDKSIKTISSLSTHSLAVTTDGTLYSWGNGDKHRLGLVTPIPLLDLHEYNCKFALKIFFKYHVALEP